MGRVADLPAGKMREFNLMLDDFSGGTNSIISQARLGKKAKNLKYAYESVNLVQDEDGIWRTKPGSAYYGNAISGISSIDGAIEYEAVDGTREIIAVGGGYAHKSTNDGSTWSQISGATFTTGYKPTFLQLQSKLYVTNRQDYLAVYNGTSFTTYGSLTDPVGAGTPSRGAGLSAGSFTYYYYFTANNEVGNTNPSPSASITVDIDRNAWDSASNETVSFSWSAVTGADSYDIWIGESDGIGFWIGRTTSTSFVDLGQIKTPYNPYQELPDDNTTASPKFGSLETSGNRIWGTYDPNNQWRVYASGTGQYLGYFSPFYGGVWIDLEKGGRFKPISVVHYRTGKGDSIATVLCTSPDGQGVIFQIELTSLTIGDTTFTVPIAYKLVGSIGSDSSHGVVKVSDNVLFPNVKGVHALRNKQSMFNVLATDDETGVIRDKWESINQNKITDVVGHYSAPRVYFSVAQGTVNDTTVVFDYERRNWNWAWSVGYNGFFDHTENSTGKTKLLVVPTSGNRLIEISDNYTNDLDSAFYQSYTSPLIPVNPADHTDRAKVKDVIYEVGELRGRVDLKVIGIQKNKQTQILGSDTLTSTTGNSGISDDLVSDFLFTDTNDTPSVFAKKSQKKNIRVNKKLYSIQFQVSTNTKDSYWKLLSIQAKGFLLGGRPSSSW